MKNNNQQHTSKLKLVKVLAIGYALAIAPFILFAFTDSKDGQIVANYNTLFFILGIGILLTPFGVLFAYLIAYVYTDGNVSSKH